MLEIAVCDDDTGVKKELSVTGLKTPEIIKVAV